MASGPPGLFCSERDAGVSPMGMDAFPYAQKDMSILQDERVLNKMLRIQFTTLPSDAYFSDPVGDIQSRMRKIVVKWMLEICDEQKCEDQVFLVAVNLLDRFLNTTRVKRTQLQLSACVCLLLASKLRQCSYLSVELLVFYTDECVTHDEVRQWEILVMSKLKWDLCPVTPIDFVDVLLQQLSTVHISDTVREHATTFIALAATESNFICVPPSHIAGAAITASIIGLNRSTLSNMEPFLNELSDKLELSSDTLIPIYNAIEKCVQRAYNSSTEDNFNSQNSGENYDQSKLQELMDTNEDMIPSNGKETPVDVLDVQL